MASTPFTIAADLTAALGAARRMGWVPVVGGLSADAIADLNDAAHAANLLLEGMTTGTGGAGALENIPEVGEESDDDVVLGAPLVAAATAGAVTPATASPKAAAPTPIAPTPPTPVSTARTQMAPPVKATPPELLAPPPLATPSTTSRASSPVGGDFFIGAATKAKATLLLAARADPWEVATLTSMPASGTATPAGSVWRAPPNPDAIFAALKVQEEAASGSGAAASEPRRPFFTGLAAMEAESAMASGATSPTAQPKHKGPPATTIPPTALTVDPNREHLGGGHIHPDLPSGVSHSASGGPTGDGPSHGPDQGGAGTAQAGGGRAKEGGADPTQSSRRRSHSRLRQPRLWRRPPPKRRRSL